MPRRLFEFECDEGHKTEHFVDVLIDRLACPECGHLTYRQISPVRSKLEGITGAFPGAYDRWTRVHEEANKKARKRKLEHEGPDA